MGKQRDLSLEHYIEETTTNIKEDRAMAKTLLMDVMADMKASPADRREMGSIAAKYVENLQRSNEQMVKLAKQYNEKVQQEKGVDPEKLAVMNVGKMEADERKDNLKALEATAKLELEKQKLVITLIFQYTAPPSGKPSTYFR